MWHHFKLHYWMFLVAKHLGTHNTKTTWEGIIALRLKWSQPVNMCNLMRVLRGGTYSALILCNSAQTTVSSVHSLHKHTHICPSLSSTKVTQPTSTWSSINQGNKQGVSALTPSLSRCIKPVKTHREHLEKEPRTLVVQRERESCFTLRLSIRLEMQTTLWNKNLCIRQ